MNNAELIARVRSIAKHGADWRINAILNQAADALEAAYKQIAELKMGLDKALARANEYEAKAIELEAQLPKEGKCEAKKPKTVKEEDYSFYCDCPTCGGRLISNVDGEWCAGTFDRFCRRCGQKIDWSEYCGWSNKPFFGARMKGEQE